MSGSAGEALGLFRRPRCVAVVGASPERGGAGGVVFAGLLSGAFRGAVWPVNPRHSSVRGHPCFPSLRSLPSVPDLVVLAVPAPAVPDLLREAAGIGVRAAVVPASGFGEAGPHGERLQEAIRGLAGPGRLRILGPNCLGVIDPLSGVDTFFIPPDSLGRPRAGPVAVLSQSGVFALALVEELSRSGPGLSVAVSFGNRCDFGETEALEALADDPRTGAVALVLESVDDGPRFVAAAARCSALKPVLAIKCGRGAAAADAVRGHTGAMAGAAEVYGAAFRRAGVVEVRTLGALSDGARALAMQPPAPGRRLLVVTNGGGFGIECADQAESAGLALPPLPTDAARRLAGRLPAFASLRNPLDVTAVATDDGFAAALEEAFVPAASPFDAAVLSCLSAAAGITPEIARHAADAARRAQRPVVALHVGGRRGEAVAEAFAAAGIPSYPTPERAVEAVRILARRGTILSGSPAARSRP